MTDPAEAAGLTGALIREAKLLSEDGKWLDSCRAAVICAYLQNLSGQPDSALETLRETQALARQHSLVNVAIWTTWGASAICAQEGSYTQAAGYLQHLEQDLFHGSHWVMADLISLVRQSMLDWQAGARSARSPTRAFDHDEVGLLIEQMLRWGIPRLDALNLSSPIWNDWVDQNGNGHAPGGVRGLWEKFRRLIRGELRLRIVDQQQVLRPTKDTAAPCDEVQHPTIPESAVPGSKLARVFDSPQETHTSTLPGQTPLLDSRSLLIPISGLVPAEARALSAHGNGHTPSLAVYCLGTFKVFVNNQLVSGWNGQKGSSILKYLVANRERPVARDILMDMFWPDSGAEVARRNLHQAIYALRQTLRRALPELQLILFENDCYRINSDVDVWMDFEEFERFVRAGRLKLEARQTLDAMEAFGLAELLYSGDFLEEELYESWPQSQREYFRSLYLEITAQISEYYIQKRQITPAMILCQKVLARDHCNERAYRDLILCHLLQGQRQLAIREYQVCVQVLKDELGLPPSDEIQALYRQIVEG